MSAVCLCRCTQCVDSVPDGDRLWAKGFGGGRPEVRSRRYAVVAHRTVQILDVLWSHLKTDSFVSRTNCQADVQLVRMATLLLFFCLGKKR